MNMKPFERGCERDGREEKNAGMHTREIQCQEVTVLRNAERELTHNM